MPSVVVLANLVILLLLFSQFLKPSVLLELLHERDELLGCSLRYEELLDSDTIWASFTVIS